MHEVVLDELERHLSGNASRAFYTHLENCGECRGEVTAMDETAALLRELRTDEGAAPDPPLGFYNRVAFHIIDEQKQEAWGLFSPGAAFFRRVAFASLLLLAGLGSYLVTREASFDTANTDAAAIMAQHDASVVHSSGEDRDHMLVTLANYHE